MLEQQSKTANLKKHQTHNRTKSKFHISKILRQKNNNQLIQGQLPFNDPLYQHLDNQVLNKQQHNFGPWVQHQRLKSRQKNRISQGDLPVIYRPQDTTARYYQQQELNTIENYDNAAPLLPSIQQRNNRVFSLQNLRAASLQFNPTNNIHQKQDNKTSKTPFYLKMHGFVYPKAVDQLEGSKKSTFIYNYCFQEDSNKLLSLKMKGFLAKNENYLKIRSQSNQLSLPKHKSNNQLLFQQLKQHRLNKLK